MYFDNAATTCITNDVKDYIISIIDEYGNPSSNYSIGKTTKDIINNTRKEVCKFINANEKYSDIIFTSSGSAANNLAIIGLTKKYNDYILYYSPTSHKSTLLCCKSLKYSHELKVDDKGFIILDELTSVLSKSDRYKKIVCVEAANSEIGTIQNIKLLCEIVHKYNGIIVLDCTGYIPTNKVDVKDINADIITFSGHKLHALKGVGVLYKKNNIELCPLIYGSQEYGLFGGTENVICIASLYKALQTYDYSSINSECRDYVYNRIVNEITDSYLVGADLNNRLLNNLYICFSGIDSQKLIALLDVEGIQVSSGSACNNGDATPSYVLTAIDFPKYDINSCIRITFSCSETISELNVLCNKLKECLSVLY